MVSCKNMGTWSTKIPLNLEIRQRILQVTFLIGGFCEAFSFQVSVFCCTGRRPRLLLSLSAASPVITSSCGSPLHHPSLLLFWASQHCPSPLGVARGPPVVHLSSAWGLWNQAAGGALPVRDWWTQRRMPRLDAFPFHLYLCGWQYI